MIASAGNDIIDLGIINTERTKDPKFYTKFITGTEIALHSSSQLSLEHFVWLLWSVKEAVYKFVQRHRPNLVFSPSKIVVQTIHPPKADTPYLLQTTFEFKGFETLPAYDGTISFGTDTFYFRSVITAKFINTVVNNTADFDSIYWGVKLIGNDAPEVQSEEVREFILNNLAGILPGVNLLIDKNPHGCPLVLNDGSLSDIPVSLAHHGHYVAYSFFMWGEFLFFK